MNVNTEDNEKKWSIVMTACSSEWTRFDEDATRIFGRPGLATFSLILCADRHLPAELVDQLTQEEAEKLRAMLTEAGAAVEVALTEELSGVRHRASEVWADRCARGFQFTELDGLITIQDSVNAAEGLAYTRSQFPATPAWKLERGLNHSHSEAGVPIEEELDNESKTVERLTLALREAYSDRAFTISHIPAQEISFWQTTPDSPKDEHSPVEDEMWPAEGWCENCSDWLRYDRTSRVDPRFTEAKWGICRECGEEMLVVSCEKLTFITPTSAAQ